MLASFRVEPCVLRSASHKFLVLKEKKLFRFNLARITTISPTTRLSPKGYAEKNIFFPSCQLLQTRTEREIRIRKPSACCSMFSLGMKRGRRVQICSFLRSQFAFGMFLFRSLALVDKWSHKDKTERGKKERQEEAFLLPLAYAKLNPTFSGVEVRIWRGNLPS